MFDIGLPELILVSIVALLVIGPERLPETIRSVSLWLGRLRKSFSKLKAEIESEIGTDDIRRQIHNESILKEFNEARDQLDKSINDTKNELDEMKDPLAHLLKPVDPETNVEETTNVKKTTLENTKLEKTSEADPGKTDT